MCGNRIVSGFGIRLCMHVHPWTFISFSIWHPWRLLIILRNVVWFVEFWSILLSYIIALGEDIAELIQCSDSVIVVSC